MSQNSIFLTVAVSRFLRSDVSSTHHRELSRIQEAISMNLIREFSLLSLSFLSGSVIIPVLRWTSARMTVLSVMV